MPFTIHCECGRAHEVAAPMAGSALDCSCGRQSLVPLLSELRALAGQDRYITNPREKIAKLLRDGYIPPGPRCLHCGVKTDGVCYCSAICERVWTETRDASAWQVALMFRAILAPFSSLLMLLTNTGDSPGELIEHGRDVVVTVPFMLCPACREYGEAKSPAQLHRLLSLVPEYAQLLAEYPAAELVPHQIEGRLFSQ